MIFPVFHREQKQQKHGRQGGRTPLMFAAMSGRREVVYLFFWLTSFYPEDYIVTLG